MQVSVKLFCALLPILASLVSISFAKFTKEKHIIQFMSGFTDVEQVVHQYLIKFSFLSQITNHLERHNVKKWDQLFFENSNFAINSEDAIDTPIFLLVGGLNELMEPEVKHPVWTEMIQRVRGNLFVLEHRCFGLSNVTDSTVEDYRQYLNSEMALYDIAYFIGVWKQKYELSKWVIVGVGYGGTLAARFRMKFPNLVDGAVAVNAPMIPQIEFKEFYDSVSMKLSKMNVLETIKEAYKVIDNDIKQNKLDQLKDKLCLCSSPADLDSNVQEKNLQYMFWSITWNLGLITMLKDTKRVLYATKLRNIFNDTSEKDPVKKVSKALEIILNRNEIICVHVKYQEAVNYLKKGEGSDDDFLILTTALGNIGVFWYSCMDFGYMKTSTKDNMFGDVTLDFYFGLCRDTFGEWYSKEILELSIRKTNYLYDVTNKDVSNILFITHAEISEKIFTITDSKGNDNIGTISIPNIPSKNLSQHMFAKLMLKYEVIYEYIKAFTGVTDLLVPSVQSIIVQDVDDTIQTDKQLIQFMRSFTDVEQYLREADVYENHFNQRFNHYDRAIKTGTWHQKIYINDEYYEYGSPIFLLVGGLSELVKPDVQDPLWTEIVQRNKGLFFSLEHRCHTENYLNVSVDEYLRTFCNSEQALYDIAFFIKTQKSFYPKSKWIVIGELHGGKLAAWSRLKFPHLVDGVLALNATLIPQKEFSEFFKFVSSELSKINGVMETIKEAYKNIENDVTNNKLEDLENKLSLCPFPGDLSLDEKKKTIKYMIWSITWTLGTIPKLRDTEENYLRTNVLDALRNVSENDSVKKLSNALLLILNQYKLTCVDVDYRQLVQSLQRPGKKLHPIVELGIETQENLWQTCTEFGHIKTSTKDIMFGDVNIHFTLDLCSDVFGSWYSEDILDRSIKITKMLYNWQNIDTTNIIFFNYVNNSEKIFSLTKNNDHQNFDIFEMDDLPKNPNDYTEEFLDKLREKYNFIFKCIQKLTKVKNLEPPNVYTAEILTIN